MGKQLLADKGWELPEFSVKELHSKKTKYCICIPIINEGKRIQKQLTVMKKYSHLADIIIADGGSTDGSTNLQFLKKQNVKALLVKKSSGKQGTQLRMGFAYALKQGYEGIITVDGNNKDGVEAIPRFINYLEQGYDNVQGSRYVKGGRGINTPFIRDLGIRLIASPLISLGSGFWFTDITNGFRGYSKKYLLHPKVQPFRNIFISYEFYFYLVGRANQIGLRSIEIPVLRKYPKGEIPTKITGFSSNFKMLSAIFKVALGLYNPKT